MLSINGSTPYKNFSVYGKGKLEQQLSNSHNFTKESSDNELANAIELAKQIKNKKDQASIINKKSSLSIMPKLGESEKSELIETAKIAKTKLNDDKKQKRPSFKTDEEIKKSLEKAKEQNIAYADKFDKYTKTEDILKAALNDLF